MRRHDSSPPLCWRLDAVAGMHEPCNTAGSSRHRTGLPDVSTCAVARAPAGPAPRGMQPALHGPCMPVAYRRSNLPACTSFTSHGSLILKTVRKIRPTATLIHARLWAVYPTLVVVLRKRFTLTQNDTGDDHPDAPAPAARSWPRGVSQHQQPAVRAQVFYVGHLVAGLARHLEYSP